MAYTVKELAKISKVSVRTLHWYDEIGLLKPAYHGANNYRYYEKEQLLLLQQILFFKELGFPLNDIQTLLGQSDFDNLKALYAHRHVLEEKLNRNKQLLATIDKTIAHLERKEVMSNKELYHGFCPTETQAEYEQYLSNRVKDYDIKAVECKNNLKDWTSSKFEEAGQEFNAICHELSLLLAKNLHPDSLEVQSIVAKHHKWLKQFWEPDQESYAGLGVGYTEFSWKQAFAVHDSQHPRLAKFLAEAMRYYAQKNLA